MTPTRIMHDFFLITSKITIVFESKSLEFSHVVFFTQKNIYLFNPFVCIDPAYYDKDNNKEKQNENIPVQEKQISQYIFPPLAFLGFRHRFFFMTFKKLKFSSYLSCFLY